MYPFPWILFKEPELANPRSYIGDTNFAKFPRYIDDPYPPIPISNEYKIPYANSMVNNFVWCLILILNVIMTCRNHKYANCAWIWKHIENWSFMPIVFCFGRSNGIRRPFLEVWNNANFLIISSTHYFFDFLGVTVFFTLTWLSEPNLLTILALIGLILTISDYVLPSVIFSIFKNETWTDEKQSKYEEICTNIILYKTKLELLVTSYYRMRVTNPKLVSNFEICFCFFRYHCLFEIR